MWNGSDLICLIYAFSGSSVSLRLAKCFHSLGTDGSSLKCLCYIFLDKFLEYFVDFFIMAAVGAAAAQVPATGKDKIDNHLLSLFMNAGVPDDQLDKQLGEFGCTNIAIFTHLAGGPKETEGLRQILKTVVGLNHEDPDPLVAVKARLDQARILSGTRRPVPPMSLRSNIPPSFCLLYTSPSPRD